MAGMMNEHPKGMCWCHAVLVGFLQLPPLVLESNNVVEHRLVGTLEEAWRVQQSLVVASAARPAAHYVACHCGPMPSSSAVRLGMDVACKCSCCL